MTALPPEARLFLERHPETRVVDAFFCDLNGVPRGKRLPVAEIGKAWSGIGINRAALLLDPRGLSLNGGGIGFGDGDPDLIATAIPGTLSPVPWSETPAAQVLLSVADAAGQPIDYDPRAALARILDRYAALALRPQVALEVEFYLIDDAPGPDGAPRPPRSPLTGRPERTGQVYGMAAVEAFGPVLGAMTEAARAQGIKTGAAVKEYGVGQFEINFAPHLEPMRAADEAILFMRLVRRVARRHGLAATFMAKPFPDQAGSGLHVHASLLDAEGRNVFDDGGPDGTPALRKAVAGILDTLPETVGLLAANPNAFRRLAPHNFVPVNRTWGYDNRSAALRIPAGPPRDRRIEHRLAGADANPYLALASVLAGILHGLAQDLEPPPPVTGDAARIEDPAMPRRWLRALDRLETARILPDYLGHGFWRAFHATKLAELDAFESLVPPAEYDLYLMAD